VIAGFIALDVALATIAAATAARRPAARGAIAVTVTVYSTTNPGSAALAINGRTATIKLSPTGARLWTGTYTISLSPGTYTVTCTVSGSTQVAAAAVQAGKTSPVLFTFVFP